LSFADQQTVTKNNGQFDLNAFCVDCTVAGLTTSSKNAYTAVPDNLFPTVNLGSQGHLIRNLLLGQKSLVLADSAPAFYVTVAITQELTQHSTTLSTQYTWTGLRPPLEAPLDQRPSPNARWGWPQADEEKNANFHAIHENRIPFEVNFGPMELMVNDILRKLEETKANEQVKELAQVADPSAPGADFELTDGGWNSNQLIEWKQIGETDFQGDFNESLNHLLRGRTLNQAMASSDDLAGPEPSKDLGTSRTVSPRKTALGWSWRILAECMATVLMALYGPEVVRSGTTNSQGRTLDE
jgi:hypothetical protein